MKSAFFLLLLCISYSIGFAQKKSDSKEINQVVEASCGQCNFNLKSANKGCDLAVRINGVAYFVDGTKIDDHGDAHAKDGFCEKVRSAEVKGKIVNGRFKATFFKLLPETKTTG